MILSLFNILSEAIDINDVEVSYFDPNRKPIVIRMRKDCEYQVNLNRNWQPGQKLIKSLRSTRSIIYASDTATSFKEVVEEAARKNASLQYAGLSKANLQGADLQRINLQEADLYKANLQGANLQGANLESIEAEAINLMHADLRGANLKFADLEGGNLQGADLRGVKFNQTNLGNLLKTDLRGAIFSISRAKLVSRANHVPLAYMDNAKIDNTTRFNVPL